VRYTGRSGFAALDGVGAGEDGALLAAVERFTSERLRQSDLHPDAWAPAVVRDLGQTEARLAGVAGPRYSYRELDQYTDLLQRVLQSSAHVAKVTRTGVLPEAIYLSFSQERLAS